MKKILIIVILGFYTLGVSQVIIGDDIGTVAANDKESVLLEFSKTEKKGIILPYVTTLPPNIGGTIALDATTGTKAKVVYYNDTEWIDLSGGEEADITSALSIQNSQTESTNAKVIIGATSSSVDGILVLESNTKAMVLPQVSNTDEIIDPSPGMMVYVTNTNDKLLAVFNGSKWTFWKANP